MGLFGGGPVGEPLVSWETVRSVCWAAGLVAVDPVVVEDGDLMNRGEARWRTR